MLILGVIGISLHGYWSVNTFTCCTLSRLRQVKSAADEFRIISDEARRPAHKLPQQEMYFSITAEFQKIDFEMKMKHSYILILFPKN